MAKKKSSKDPFSEFTKTLEKQRKEMEKLAKPFLEYPKHMEKMVRPFLDYQQKTEKMAKPILEYHRKLLEESKRFQEVWVQNVSERVLKEIEKLPKSRLQEVLDFVGYLISKDRNVQSTEPEEQLDPSQDPILRMIGRVSNGSLAKNIDKELYGE